MRTAGILLAALGYSITALFAAGWIKARYGSTRPRTSETLSTVLFLTTMVAAMIAGSSIDWS
jgi:hypothetical protein